MEEAVGYEIDPLSDESLAALRRLAKYRPPKDNCANTRSLHHARGTNLGPSRSLPRSTRSSYGRTVWVEERRGPERYPVYAEHELKNICERLRVCC